MITEDLKVANVKCGGCVATIKNEIIKLEGVKNVEAFHETDLVTVTYEGITRAEISIKLSELGYPEATMENGLLVKLKSYKGQ